MAQTIMDVLEQDSTFRTLVNAIKQAGYDQQLRQSGPFTFFAPTEAAIEAMPDRQFFKWQTDTTKLTKVLKFHTAAGRYSAADLLDMSFVKTVEGQRLHSTSQLDQLGYADVGATDAYGYVMGGTISVAVKQTIKINGAAIVMPDLAADNGFVHGIDKVLVPWLLDIVH